MVVYICLYRAAWSDLPAAAGAAPRLEEQDVGRLHVAVDDPVAVQAGQPGADLICIFTQSRGDQGEHVGRAVHIRAAITWPAMICTLYPAPARKAPTARPLPAAAAPAAAA